MYPSNQDYKIALLTGPDSFRTLEGIESLPNPNYPNEIWFATGGLAIVFKVKYQNKTYALKCFTKEVKEREDRLLEISKYLSENPSPYFVDFTYLENEIWIENEEGGSGYPVVLMEWVEGLTLDNYLKVKCRDYEIVLLDKLYDNFCKMADYLQSMPIAHGDLKHDNIIILPSGEFKLIDYDGMFIPLFVRKKATELGSPCYQHPKRDSDYFNKRIDDFSLLILQTTLFALKKQPNLFALHFNGDGLIFKAEYFNSNFNWKALFWLIVGEELVFLTNQIRNKIDYNWPISISINSYYLNLIKLGKYVNNREFENVYHHKLMDIQYINNAIELAYISRTNFDYYFDPYDLDINEINETEKSFLNWKINLISRIYYKIENKNVDFDYCHHYIVPKNNIDDGRVNYYMIFEDYVFRYLIAMILYEDKDQLISDVVCNYHKRIFHSNLYVDTEFLYRETDNLFLKWILEEFYNKKDKYLLHLDIKKYYQNTDVTLLLRTISDKLNLKSESYFYRLLYSNMLFKYIGDQQIVSKNCLIIQEVDRFYSDIYLDDIDSESNSKDFVYNRKMDDLIYISDNSENFNKIFELVAEELSILNLQINLSKTEILGPKHIESAKEYGIVFALIGSGEFGINGITYNRNKSKFSTSMYRVYENNYESGIGVETKFMNELCRDSSYNHLGESVNRDFTVDQTIGIIRSYHISYLNEFFLSDKNKGNKYYYLFQYFKRILLNKNYMGLAEWLKVYKDFEIREKGNPNFNYLVKKLADYLEAKNLLNLK
jgi:serine/threonine protein kinase